MLNNPIDVIKSTVQAVESGTSGRNSLWRVVQQTVEQRGLMYLFTAGLKVKEARPGSSAPLMCHSCRLD